jgi:surface carbohydrate biosynthesis protein (TIGR04326 family)
LISLINNNVLDKYSIFFKSHPGSSRSLVFDFDRFGFNVVNEPISDLLLNSDLVCSSNSTSASLDAYCAGLDVLIYSDHTQFNMSPLKGFNDVLFFQNNQELEKNLTLFLEKNSRKSNIKVFRDYFFIDLNLEKWKNIIKMHQG